VSRCVPIRHGFASGIGDRTSVSLRLVMKVGQQSPVVTRKHIHINEIPVKLITDISFAKYRSYIPR